MSKTEQPQKKVSRIKEKKKSWFKIVTPKSLGLKEIGESYLASPESAMGRLLKIGLKELTGNVKDQNAYLSLTISSVQGGKLMTKLVGYELTSAYVRRAVKKNTNRVDDFFILTAKDGRKIILKGLMITISKTKQSAKTLLRKQFREALQEEIGKTDFDTFVNNLIFQKIQPALRKKLNKVYPLREMAIRTLQIKNWQANLSTADVTEVVAEGATENTSAAPASQ